MSSRRLVQYLTAVILILLGVVGYCAYILGGMAPARQPTIKIVTNTLNQIAVRKVNSTNVLATLAGRINWASIESTNYHTYITNLRAIGCPEETVRDIIITDISKLFASFSPTNSGKLETLCRMITVRIRNCSASSRN